MKKIFDTFTMSDNNLVYNILYMRYSQMIYTEIFLE